MNPVNFELDIIPGEFHATGSKAGLAEFGYFDDLLEYGVNFRQFEKPLKIQLTVRGRNHQILTSTPITGFNYKGVYILEKIAPSTKYQVDTSMRAEQEHCGMDFVMERYEKDWTVVATPKGTKLRLYFDRGTQKEESEGNPSIDYKVREILGALMVLGTNTPGQKVFSPEELKNLYELVQKEGLVVFSQSPDQLPKLDIIALPGTIVQRFSIPTRKTFHKKTLYTYTATELNQISLDDFTNIGHPIAVGVFFPK